MKQFSQKFDEDHDSVEMLPLADRVKWYNFNGRSVQDEIFALYVAKYSTEGIMTFDQFVGFLDAHKIKLPGSERTESMFDQIELIFGTY